MICNITPQLLPLAIPLDDCHLDPANARTGHDVDMIAASLTQYGQRTPIVINRSEGGKIEKGNGTWKAAKALGWTHIAAVMVEDAAMTAVGYAIADNRASELSQWDDETLVTLLSALDMDEFITGFDEDDLAAMVDSFGDGDDLDYKEAWAGMPEFEQDDISGIKLAVHFENEADMERFGQIVGQPVNGKTKSIWFPKKDNLDLKSYRVLDES
jgi:hypothetical protein